MVGTEELDTRFTEEIISDIEGNDKEVMDEEINMNGENVTSIMDFFNNRRSKTVIDWNRTENIRKIIEPGTNETAIALKQVEAFKKRLINKLIL